MAILSLLWHPRLVAGGEVDRYLQVAEGLLAGQFVDDPFHPLLYPLLVAGVGLVTPTVFAAGKLVSAAAYGLLLFSVYRLLRHYLAAGAALVGALAIGIGPVVWQHGMLVSSDMLATALVVAAYTLALTSAGERRRLLAIGLLAGAAVVTRFNLALHLALLLLIVLVRTRRLGRVIPVVLGAVLGALPHYLVRWFATGDVANPSWQILVVKYEFGSDWAPALQHSDAELRAALLEKWPAWLLEGFGDFAAWCGGGLPRLLVPKSIAVPGFGWVVLALLLLGCGAALIRRRATAVWLLGAAVVHFAAVTLAHGTSPRVLMPGFVLLVAAAMIGVAGMRRRWPAVLIGLAVIGWHAAVTPASWSAFRRSHAEPEIAAARDLVEEHGALIQIIGTYEFLAREVGCAQSWRVNPPTLEAADFWPRIENARAALPAPWIVLGRISNSTLYRIGRTVPLPPNWRRVRSDDEVVVLHFDSGARELIGLQVEPANWRSGELLLRLSWQGEPADVAWAGVELRGPEGALQRVVLTGDGNVRELSLAHGGLGPGSWQIVPIVLRPDGSIVQGEPRVVRVE